MGVVSAICTSFASCSPVLTPLESIFLNSALYKLTFAPLLCYVSKKQLCNENESIFLPKLICFDEIWELKDEIY